MMVKLRYRDSVESNFKKREVFTWSEVEMIVEDKRIRFHFPYIEDLKNDIKSMEGSRFDKETKSWSIANSVRNRFRLAHMRWMGRKNGEPVVPGTYDPYERFDAPLIDTDLSDRPYYDHQKEGVRFLITRRQCILAWEMGTGKTLTVGRTMEWAREMCGWTNNDDFIYVGPAAALHQVMLDFEEWKIKVHPRFITYQGMTKMVQTWPKGQPAPKFVVFDESTKIKSATAQMSQAALHLANSMREEYGPAAFVILMTGSPAPKNPADWWHQCEVACPGFIKEGSQDKFKERLAIIERIQDEAGGGYPKLKTWLDDEKKCKVCGELANAPVHGAERRLTGQGHPWEKSKNEVEALYGRFKGLVVVKFKKDCIDLPKKVYKIIRCKPTQQLLNAAKLVSRKARTTIQALTLLRELSDGFQYKDEAFDYKDCPRCAGTCTQVTKLDPENPEEPITQEAILAQRFIEVLTACDMCGGQGTVDVTRRVTAKVACPKDDAMRELLEEHEDVGRLVTYAGFTGSVDRVVDVSLNSGWHVVRVDGRGWAGLAPQGAKALPLGGKALYRTYRYDLEGYPKINFVAQASSAGHGLNLTASPTEVFYSNDFNFECRIQAEDRFHRLGIHATLERMKKLRPDEPADRFNHVTVVDLVHLESDLLILENHRKKKVLQAMTLGDLQTSLDNSKVIASRD
jgi:hypothetical protein